MVTVAKKFVVHKVFEGLPKATDLSLVEELLTPLSAGEIMVEAEYLSLDAYVRPLTLFMPLGATVPGIQVAKIIESRNLMYPKGRRVVAFLGWRTHTVFNPDYTEGFNMIQHRTYTWPDDSYDLPASLALGVLGLPGNAAYFGFTEICKPLAGETVVVSSAAGTVGSHVGQIAKILNCQVIGITGTDEKCKWIVDELGFDHAINYKTEDVATSLKKAAPNGVDCYFDNVGGEISSTVIHQMRNNGRISICGSTACYNAGNILSHNCLPNSTILQPPFVFHQLKMEGFFITRWGSRWHEGIEKNLAWIREGKLQYKETITEGFENSFEAFLKMLSGKSIGKSIVKIMNS